MIMQSKEQFNETTATSVLEGNDRDAFYAKIAEKEKTLLGSFEGKAGKLASTFLLMTTLVACEMPSIAKVEKAEAAQELNESVAMEVLPSTQGDIDYLYNNSTHIPNLNYSQKLSLAQHHGWIKELAQLETIHPQKEFIVKEAPHSFEFKVKFLTSGVGEELKKQNIDFDENSGRINLKNENRVIDLDTVESPNVPLGFGRGLVEKVFVWGEKADAVAHLSDWGKVESIKIDSLDKGIVRVKIYTRSFGSKDLYLAGGKVVYEVTSTHF